MENKSKILVIGGTGYIGKHIVNASVAAGHPTYALVRELNSGDPAKAHLLESFKSKGVILLQGDVEDYPSLLNAIKQVDVVISTVGRTQTANQVKIIAAIKEAGNIKRFFPSEFGNDVDRSRAVEPANTAYDTKRKIRRAVEAEGIPYTYVCNHFFAGYFLTNFAQPGLTSPPRDKVVIMGDGNLKTVFVKEEDVGTFTIKAVDDPTTLNKTLYIKPPSNTLSFNELVELWEKKIGKTLQRIYVSDEQILKSIQEAPFPMKVVMAISHSVLVRGDHAHLVIEESFGYEATRLYPDVEYTTVDEYLNQFV